MKHFIITGATGRAGAAAVRAVLADSSATCIVWTRRPTGVVHSRLCERLVDDFGSYESLAEDIERSTAMLWCLGVAQSQVAAADYVKITYEFPVAAARAVAARNPRLRFCFLSAGGADSSERSLARFARVKGRAENALLATLDDVYCLRPGYIRSKEPARNSRTWVDRTFGLLAPALQHVLPELMIDDDALARAMLQITRSGADARVLENAALRRLAITFDEATATPRDPRAAG